MSNSARPGEIYKLEEYLDNCLNNNLLAPSDMFGFQKLMIDAYIVSLLSSDSEQHKDFCA